MHTNQGVRLSRVKIEFWVEVTYPYFIMLIDVFESADRHSIFSFYLEKVFTILLWFVAI